jgi:hypothetical protein
MATNRDLVGFDAVRPHTTAYSAHRTVGSVRPRIQYESGRSERRLRERLRATLNLVDACKKLAPLIWASARTILQRREPDATTVPQSH